MRTLVNLLASLFVTLAGPVLLGALLWALVEYLREPTEARWYLAGLLGVLLLAALNALANWRLGIAKWKFWQWKELLQRACTDRHVFYRLAVGTMSSFVISVWVVHGAGIDGWPWTKIAALVVAAFAWPLAFMVRPLFYRGPKHRTPPNMPCTNSGEGSYGSDHHGEHREVSTADRSSGQ